MVKIEVHLHREGATMQLQDIAWSVLDLAAVAEGKTPRDAFHASRDLAQHAEKLGYKRFWLAEHHSNPAVASSATSLVIGYVAEGTSTIRVGSGGVMLPNHAPLVIAEQFGTLEALYPGRIDLGLGRAPGTDRTTMRALRRNKTEEDFADNIAELQSYLATPNQVEKVRAIPGEGTNIPLWILGSSLYSAKLAGILGLPYAFASHFAPHDLLAALQLYRDSFQPSDVLQEPYTLACVNVVAADHVEQAQQLATSMYQFSLNIIRRRSDLLQPPVPSMDAYWDEFEKNLVLQQLYYSFIGDTATIKKELQIFLEETKVDEIMVCSHIYDHAQRVHSYKLLAETVIG